MANKSLKLALLLFAAALFGCSRMALHEDFGKSVSKNKVLQAQSMSAPQESHPDVKMDGSKAVSVVDNYRNERPEADDTDLTK